MKDWNPLYYLVVINYKHENMKKLFNYLLIAIMAIAMAFTACNNNNNDDDDDPLPPSGGTGSGAISSLIIDAQNVINGNNNIATVKVIADWEENDDWKDYEVISAKFENNGFKFTLKSELPKQCLYYPCYESYIEVSDRNAQLGWVGLSAFNVSGREIGEFYLYEETYSGYTEALFVYASKNVTLKGTEKDEGYYYDYVIETDCSLKKGWNMVYYSEQEGYDAVNDKYIYKELLTTQKPAGANLRWHFYGYDIYSRVRFVKESEWANCNSMFVAHDYDGYISVLAEAIFGYGGSGISGYSGISSGVYFTGHDDYDGFIYIDVDNYSFEPDRAYSVVCSGTDNDLNFYVTDDGPAKSKKSNNCKFLQKKNPILSKGKKISKDKIELRTK